MMTEISSENTESLPFRRLVFSPVSLYWRRHWFKRKR